MIGCPAALQSFTTTHGPPQKGDTEGGYRQAKWIWGFTAAAAIRRMSLSPDNHSLSRYGFSVPPAKFQALPLPCRTVALNVRQCP